ncbi:MAG: serine/threonine protein kinase [Planctomycetales bacterium]|nr:serine/threonine protein kinase [Planctomycetales bacterium]
MSDSEPKLETADSGGENARGDSVSTIVAPEVVIEAVKVISGSSGNIHDIALPTDKTVISKRALSTDVAPPAPPTSQSLGAALVGKKFGNYELAEFVGGGGMGAVFRAIDTSMGRTVAVKVLSRDHTDDETIRRFRNEAQSAARLDHPNIARAYYVGEHEGWNFIVFEFVEGTNLRELVEKRGPLPVEEALNYTLQVAQALDHAADREVVHRDIKPSNVLVTPAGEIKLVDMGLARMHQVDSSADDLTASGVTLGTFDYISPEQARDPRIADSRSDIYSLGCTLYFMLAGRPPFPDGTALQKLLWHSGEDPPDPRLFRPELPTQVIRLLEKMLAKRPAQRPQSPRELMAEITAVADALGFVGFGKGRSPAQLAAPGQSAWSLAASILVPIAALVLLIWLVDAWQPQTDTGTVLLRPKLEESIPSDDQKGESGSKSSAADAKKTANETPVPPVEGTKSGSPPVEQPGVASEEPLIGPVPTPLSKNGTGAETPSPEEKTTAPSGSPAKLTESGAALAAADAMPPAELRAEPAETVSLTSSNAPPSGAAKPKIAHLVVRPDGKPLTTLAPDQELVRTFARACQRAAELGVQDIELQFTGESMEQALELGASRLTIKAAAGHKPVIVFRPELKGAETDKQMIRLKCGSAGKVTFQGVELRMELPAEPSFGWSLFAIYQMQSLNLADCILTIKDAGSSGAPIQTQVAFFALQPRRIADAMKMMEDDMRMIPAMGVNLDRCIARGEATFLMASEESPLKVVWRQGLLVTTQRLIETEGSPLRPSEFGRLDIDLDHVTAIIPQGLYSMKRRPSNAYQLKADIRCSNSLLQTASQTPLFEFTDLPAIEDVQLAFGGEGNLYPTSKGIFLRFKPMSRGEPSVDFPQESRPRWSSEERSSAGFTWKDATATETIPAHRQVPKNYLLDPDSRYQAGVDPGVLPEPSAPVEKPAEKPVEPAGEGDQE